MKVLNEEQFAEMQTDLSQLIGLIQSVSQNFDAEKIKKDIVSEFKISLRENSLFESLKVEEAELAANLLVLKQVRKEFIECRKISELKIVGIVFVGMVAGGILTAAIFKYYGL